MLKRYKTILVEDETPARNRLKRLLAEYESQVEIIGEAGNGQEGLQLIEKLKPELVFLDVQMPLLNGFELITKLSYNPVIVFTTAYEAFAIKAFEQNSIDYLLKPIEPERLALTMKKLQQRVAESSAGDNMSKELTSLINQLQKQKMTSIPVKIGDRILLLNLDEVCYFEAKEKYVFIHTSDGKEHLIDFTLNSLEEKLPSDQFLRVHRAIIVNRNSIREVKKYFDGKYILLMNDKAGAKIETGANYSDPIKNLISF